MPAKREASSPDAPTAIRGIEANLVDCMVALPGQLFYSTQAFEALAA